ncbi:MAG TPA: sensor domain-containing diguanylate cyclase [Anaerolineales bacterium]
MAIPSDRGDVLAQARRIVIEDGRLSPKERQDLLKLISSLAEASAPVPEPQQSAQPPAALRLEANSASHALLSLLKQQADELDALKKLSLNLTSSLDIQTVLDAVVMEAMRLVKNAFTADIFLYSGGELHFGASMDLAGPRKKPYMDPRQDGLTFTVARGGEPVFVEDMATHPFYRDLDTRKEGSIIGIPLMINNNVVGVMNLSRSITGSFSPPELRLLGLLADQASVAISNASLHQMVSKQAYSDTVTGLPNRRALDERLEREVLHARRTGFPFAVIMMDLDGFKQINDTHGHSLGDQVLRDLFKYLASGLRSSDFLARYGGDELTLILSQTDLPAARLVTEKLLDHMRNYQFPLPGGGSLTLSLSGGVALYPIHAMSGTDLLRAADEALYRAKKHNRGSFVIAYGFTGPLSHS